MAAMLLITIADRPERGHFQARNALFGVGEVGKNAPSRRALDFSRQSEA